VDQPGSERYHLLNSTLSKYSQTTKEDQSSNRSLNSQTTENLIIYFEGIKQIWDVYSVFKSIGDLIWPGTSLDDVITEIIKAKEEILKEINEVAAEEQIRFAHAYINNFNIWLKYRDPAIWDWLKQNGQTVKTQLEPLIRDEAPYIAYLTCTTYNLFIPALIIVYANADFSTFEKQAIENAIDINERVLLGSVCFKNINLPFYNFGNGKLWQYFIEKNSICTDESFKYINYLWKATEELKMQADPNYADYKNNWFLIGGAGLEYPYKFLVLRDGHKVTFSTPGWWENQKPFSWKFDFQNYPFVKIRHSMSFWLGHYLDAERDYSYRNLWGHYQRLWSDDYEIVHVFYNSFTSRQEWIVGNPSWICSDCTPIPGIFIFAPCNLTESVSGNKKLWCGYLAQRLKDKELTFNLCHFQEKSYRKLDIIISASNFTTGISQDYKKEDNLESYSLSQNFPNPFNLETTIEYALPDQAHVKLIIFNLIGEKIATLVNQEQNAGFHKYIWNAKGQPSGVYFYKLEAGSFTEIKKMILVQ